MRHFIIKIRQGLCEIELDVQSITSMQALCDNIDRMPMGLPASISVRPA